jgi:hypothetical protein
MSRFLCRSVYFGYLPTDFYEIYNANILDREGSISNNKFKKCNFNTSFVCRKLCAIIIRLLNIKK